MESISNSYSYRPNQYYTRPYNREYYTVHNSQTGDNSGFKTVASAAILQGAALLLKKASSFFSAKLMQGKEFTNEKNVNIIADKMLNDNNLKQKISVEFVTEMNKDHIANRYGKIGQKLSGELSSVAGGENAFYSDAIKLAVAPKSKPSLILHELGHAINAHSGKLLKFLQESRGKLTAIPSVLLLFNQLTPKEENNKKTFIERNAGKIGFLAFLPTIIEEGIASLRAISASKKVNKAINASMDIKALKKNYAFAWMTYLISGILFGIGTKLTIMENQIEK